MKVGRGRRARAETGRLALAVVAALAACTSDGERSAVPPGDARDASCAPCHERQADDAAHFAAHRGPEDAYGCLLCHGPHADGDGAGPAPLVATCQSCHREVVAEFELPFSHRLGAMIACTDCHAAHGGRPREMRERLRHDACVKCHGELRGPFVFEHEASRNLACLSCHEAHGSANRRMVTYADARLLCLSCHQGLEDHLQEPGSPFRDCLNCHVSVHGSNWDRNLLR